MRILAIISGEYGQRHVNNIRRHGPTTDAEHPLGAGQPQWEIEVWHAPAVLPLMIDYPEDHLPDELPEADLILSFAELKGVAELLPDIARMTGAQAVIAPVDNEAWLPRGLARQLRGWLEDIGVVCVTPKPLCSLTETDYGVTRRQRIEYDNPLIAEFARWFGQPKLDITVDPETRTIVAVDVQRDAVCGCARYVAQGLIGVSVDEAEEQAGLLHHHYPCLASMGIDSAFGDTLMHVSGNVLKDNVAAQVRPFRRVRYYVPDKEE
jgi:hypothetical protein